MPEGIAGPGDGVIDPDGRILLGKDFEYGSADDVDRRFIAEPFDPVGISGWNDTLNTVAFALSKGQAHAHGGGRTAGPWR
jgi:hypothetical protein